MRSNSYRTKYSPYIIHIRKWELKISHYENKQLRGTICRKIRKYHNIILRNEIVEYPLKVT